MSLLDFLDGLLHSLLQVEFDFVGSGLRLRLELLGLRGGFGGYFDT